MPAHSNKLKESGEPVKISQNVQATSEVDEPDTQLPAADAYLETAEGYVIWLGATCTLGRSKTNQVVLMSPRASRQHALLHRQNLGEYWLIDLGSNNGSHVNRRRIQQPTLLKDGDQIELGGQLFFFSQKANSTETSTSATDRTQTDRQLEAVRCWLLLADIKGFSRMAGEIPLAGLAELVGKWFSKCRETIESGQGKISEYLGDGFLACWADGVTAVQEVQKAVKCLREFQDQPLKFRLALHFGELGVCRLPCAGDNKLIGSNVNFVFRLEKLASRLDSPFILSAAAAEAWPERPALRSLGRHGVPGFDGEHEVYCL